MPHLDVATWNVKSGKPAGTSHWRFAPGEFENSLSNVVDEFDPDVLFLQEFPFLKEDPERFIRRLKESTRLKHVHFGRFSESHLDESVDLGLVIASRHPLGYLQSHDLPLPDNGMEINGRQQKLHKRGILTATISCEEGDIALVNVHLPPFRALNRDPGEAIFLEMRRAFGVLLQECLRPAIVAGDFNCENVMELEECFVNSSEWRATIASPTTINGRCIDDILITESISDLESSCLVTLSDHAYCRALLKVGQNVSGVAF